MESYPFKETTPRLFSHTYRPKTPVWTTAPKEIQPVSFNSALQWAKHLGDAAVLGYEVIYRQPRIHELITDTPVSTHFLLSLCLIESKI